MCFLVLDVQKIQGFFLDINSDLFGLGDYFPKILEPETQLFGTFEMTSPTFGPLVRLVVVWVRWDDILEIILTPKE